LICWRLIYYPPEKHKRISQAELQYILADKTEPQGTQAVVSHPRWRDLLNFPQTWGIIVAKAFTDPVWFFVTDWFPIYLVAKGIELRSSLVAIWIPFLAADVGNFSAGALSGWLIQRGWSIGAARKALVVFGGIGVMMLIPTVFTNNLYWIASMFGLATFSYAAFSTMANVLPSDVFRSDSVASVSGMSGTGAGIGTIIAFKLVGHLSDARQATGSHSFDPIVIVAGLVPFIGMLLVLLLVRNTKATEQGFVRRI
jgi:ACS family hexuronate transporter-like MFS transporter